MPFKSNSEFEMAFLPLAMSDFKLIWINAFSSSIGAVPVPTLGWPVCWPFGPWPMGSKAFSESNGLNVNDE